MDLNTVKNVGVGAIIVLAVIGVLAAIIIRKIVGKVLSLLIAAALVFFAWQQRDHVINYADEMRGQACQSPPRFFGIQVNLPDDWCTTASSGR
ncbi:hypothetical protein [Nakamurella aerolata]|uniref:Uncharacterized protein n=1 Tax=Nakamurella aerolata TaxID=1656892 RepID=A0A849A806_9ACTN|nr:hypothetical protein [Nakamurella aerolata]NNG35633.1 hypothetical protein [Nakamurella aerolata]